MVSTGYFENIRQEVFSMEVNQDTKLRFTYTPMHGVGHDYMRQAFEIAGFAVSLPGGPLFRILSITN